MNLFEEQQNEFQQRHIGPDENETADMLKVIGKSSMEELIEATIPQGIRIKKPLEIADPNSEHEYLKELKQVAAKNKLFRSYIGQGYYDTITPSVILEMFLKTRDGIHNTHLTRQKFHRDVWKAF